MFSEWEYYSQSSDEPEEEEAKTVDKKSILGLGLHSTEKEADNVVSPVDLAHPGPEKGESGSVCCDKKSSSAAKKDNSVDQKDKMQNKQVALLVHSQVESKILHSNKTLSEAASANLELKTEVQTSDHETILNKPKQNYKEVVSYAIKAEDRPKLPPKKKDNIRKEDNIQSSKAEKSISLSIAQEKSSSVSENNKPEKSKPFVPEKKKTEESLKQSLPEKVKPLNIKEENEVKSSPKLQDKTKLTPSISDTKQQCQSTAKPTHTSVEKSIHCPSLSSEEVKHLITSTEKPPQSAKPIPSLADQPASYIAVQPTSTRLIEDEPNPSPPLVDKPKPLLTWKPGPSPVLAEKTKPKPLEDKEKTAHPLADKLKPALSVADKSKPAPTVADKSNPAPTVADSKKPLIPSVISNTNQPSNSLEVKSKSSSISLNKTKLSSRIEDGPKSDSFKLEATKASSITIERLKESQIALDKSNYFTSDEQTKTKVPAALCSKDKVKPSEEPSLQDKPSTTTSRPTKAVENSSTNRDKPKPDLPKPTKTSTTSLSSSSLIKEEGTKPPRKSVQQNELQVLDPRRTSRDLLRKVRYYYTL